MLDARAVGFDVWKVTDKRVLPRARRGGGSSSELSAVAGCSPAPPAGCSDANAVPGPAGSLAMYQALAVCGGVEEGP